MIRQHGGAARGSREAKGNREGSRGGLSMSMSEPRDCDGGREEGKGGYIHILIFGRDISDKY